MVGLVARKPWTQVHTRVTVSTAVGTVAPVEGRGRAATWKISPQRSCCRLTEMLSIEKGT